MELRIFGKTIAAFVSKLSIIRAQMGQRSAFAARENEKAPEPAGAFRK
jgi:hypothetical protein